jgi:hypothetical protein
LLSGGQQMFVRSVEFVDGKAEPVFKTEYVPFGIQLTMLPTALADGKAVHLEVETAISRPNFAQPGGYRVTITPSDDPEGANARTETLRRPEMATQAARTSVNMPVGRTLLVCLGMDESTKQQVVAMLTPKVITPPPVACPPPPVAPIAEEQAAPPAEPKLAKLLAKYRQACAAGDAAQARRLADRCLAIDPTCFGK